GEQGHQDGRGVARGAHSGPIRGPSTGRHRAGVHRPLLERARRRHLPLRGLRDRALQLGHQVRLGHRLAQLHRAGGGRGGRDARGQRLRHGAHRSGLPHLRRTPRARVPGRSARPGRPALLHQLGGARARAQGL
ncbi:MAG: Peptide-methionine (R)-S-oxide reductase MsrB, partial [uncultured Solirubrobacteraceae bacterium]